MTSFKKEAGLSTPIILGIVAAVIIIGGGGYYLAQQVIDAPRTPTTLVPTSPTPAVQTPVTNVTPVTTPVQESTPVSFEGTVLAGTSAPLLDFNKADFDKALASDKLIVLYFFANWCPTCKAEFPKMQAAFNSLTTSDVVAFRVNFNDNQTDDFEKALAREHGIGYQHTKVFIRNGQQILKSPETWEQSRYTAEIQSALAQ